MADDIDESMRSRNTVPFKIIAGHHGGIISQIREFAFSMLSFFRDNNSKSRNMDHLVVDATCRFMITASGNRGWFGDSTRTVLVHSITPN